MTKKPNDIMDIGYTLVSSGVRDGVIFPLLDDIADPVTKAVREQTRDPFDSGSWRGVKNQVAVTFGAMP